jgi:DNA-binding transcriptional ArsR family regulator
MYAMADIFDVVSDSTRREILGILLTRSASAAPELSVSDLVTATQLSQPTVSKQLKVLRDAGLVAVREDGQHRYYRLDTAPLASLGAWLKGFVPTPESFGGTPRPTAKKSPASSSSPAAEAQSVLPPDLRTVASEAGAVAATAIFRIRESWGDLKVQVRGAAERATSQMRK